MVHRISPGTVPEFCNSPSARNDCCCKGCGILVFVYGTLKKGGSAHDMMSPCTEITRSASLPGILVPMGWYPAMVPYKGCTVYGEIYRVTPNTLQRLDGYEGVDRGLYARHLVHTQWGEVFVYVQNKIIPSETTRVVDNGMWIPERSANQQTVSLKELEEKFKITGNSVAEIKGLVENKQSTVCSVVSLPTSCVVETKPIDVRTNKHLIPEVVMS